MIPPLQGDAVHDERQQDGSRHLELEMVDPLGRWLCSLHCILARDGTLREAEMDLDSPDGPWSAGLDVVEQISTEGPLRLLALFTDAGFTLRLDLRESDDGCGFLALLESDADEE
jgi:hypothetical protein